MKTFRPPLECIGCKSGFVNLALYILEGDKKSLLSMSGHAPWSFSIIDPDLRVARAGVDLGGGGWGG